MGASPGDGAGEAAACIRRTCVRPPRPLALAAWFALALGPLELAGRLALTARAIDENDWARARAGVEAVRREGDLVVVRNHQGVFNEVVRAFLKSITYRDGFVSVIHLPAFEAVDVVVDPHRNSGQPTVDRVGVGVEDILSRVRAGEPLAEVGDDFGLTARELRSLIIQAA